MPLTPQNQTQADDEEHPEPPCEFTTPCITTSSTTSNPRKLISHIFGRNKSATRLFPAHVWVHYCRKHYQRARYRSASWAFTQCELLMDSLERMERWGGVLSFEVVLRKREVERIESGIEVESKNGNGDGGGSRGGNAGEDGDDESSSDTYTTKRVQRTNRNSKTQARRKPKITPCPVPDWLRQETGANKSFDDIRDILRRVREDMGLQQKSGREELVRFPDIEILPTFRRWVSERPNGMEKGNASASTARGISASSSRKGKGKGKGGKKGSRVSKKGAVKKTR